MRILALETSTEWCSVAVGEGTRWLQLDEKADQAHSQRLLPMVDTVLKEAGWSLRDIDGIAFGAGPGSFTGIRIGCGVAQGLALGADLPLAPVPTLLAVAAEAFRAHRWHAVLACVDARMREVYVAAYRREGDRWLEVAAPAVCRPGDVVLPATGERAGWSGAGNGFLAYPTLDARLLLAAADGEVHPTAQAIGELAAPRFAAGEGVAAAEALPVYVRHRVALTTAERDAGIRL